MLKFLLIAVVISLASTGYAGHLNEKNSISLGIVKTGENNIDDKNLGGMQKSSDSISPEASIVMVEGLGGNVKNLGAVQEASKWSDPITWFTFALVVLTGGLVWIGFRQDQSNRTIQRAYVKLSHYPNGIYLNEDGTFHVSFEVKNHGNTPAQVTDILIKPIILHCDEQLPVIPEYSRQRSDHFFHTSLVAGECFTYFNPEQFVFRKEDLACLRNGAKILFLIGYVDYIDRFGGRHRAGYARRYNRLDDDIRNPSRNNLIFVTQAGYNYDRKRNKEEGSDWGI